MKLVTPKGKETFSRWLDFNPHEREARDRRQMVPGRQNHHFNPHEREARDARQDGLYLETIILIHTSVKLVTPALNGQTTNVKAF